MGIEPLLTSFLIFSFFGVASVSIYRHRQVNSVLDQKLDANEDFKSKVSEQFGIAEGAVVGVSVFDVLYNTYKMDPNAIDGMAHLHHSRDFESLSEFMEFMNSEIISGDIARQTVHKYKGFTGEEAFFEKWEAAGHEVQVPDSGTNEAYDAILDGQKINIKTTDNPATIQEHLNEHPDIPVYTNKEMGEAFSDNPMVKVDPDISAQDAFHTTQDTFEGMMDLGGMIDQVPLITLGISSVKNARSFKNGDKEFKDAAEHVISDTVGVGFGGWAGAKVGLAAGTALAPVTGGLSAAIIPAASSIVGSIMGIFTGKGITNWFKNRHVRSAIDKLKNVASKFYSQFLDKFELIKAKVNNDYRDTENDLNEKLKERSSIWKRWIYPDVMTKFFSRAKGEIQNEWNNTLRFYQNLSEKLNEQDEKYEAGILLYNQGRSILLDIDELTSQYGEVDRALQKVEEEKCKVD